MSEHCRRWAATAATSLQCAACMLHSTRLFACNMRSLFCLYLPALLICSATRTVCALAEARAHAIAAARTPADRTALLGDDEVQLWMEQMEDRMISIASNAGEAVLGLRTQHVCWVDSLLARRMHVHRHVGGQCRMLKH